MTTSAAFEDVRAAMQVAHAISTHKVERQFDYYTAVDDLVEASDETGAGMIGDVEFNSATYYKYLSLHWEGFLRNLGNDPGDEALARATVSSFLKAAATTTPTGKQNSFAAHNPPDAILVEVKSENTPISYANAFVKPVSATADRDLVEASIAAFVDYVPKLKSAYNLAPVASLFLTTRDHDLPGAARVAGLAEMTEAMLRAIPAGG
jgi:CRISPR system Cascade subunit CasC